MTAVVLALLLPLAGAGLIRLFVRRLSPGAAAGLASAAVGLAHVLSWLALCSLLGNPPEERIRDITLFPFLSLPGLSVDVALRWDVLSQTMLMVVTGVAFLIHVYSIAYMKGDSRYAYFFADLNLFVFSMLLLVLGGNFVLLFAGWELVGLSSYLLIGYWSFKPAAADAGRKAFLVNRIGDAGFIVGMLLLAVNLGSLNYSQVFTSAPGAIEAGSGLALAIALCLFCGAIGKSAQFPLHVWLPDAMEGPTPVSALIHAATMVTAGVYMVCRCHVLFELAPAALVLVAWLGAFTALLAGLMALAQADLKRIFAYSTVSQLGLMFLAAGVGAYDAAMFHLFTHAFFKALLFLCAGSVMHALSGELDVWKMGGLRRHLPVTFVTCLIGTLALAGAPLTAGFFSKDEILLRAMQAHPHGFALWGAGLAISLLTSLYAFRALGLVFLGSPRYGEKLHPHEAPFLMLLPLAILAVGALAAGYLWLPAAFAHFAPFSRFLEPVLGAAGAHHVAPGRSEAAMGAAVAVFIAGLIAAAYAYAGGGEAARRLARRAGGLYAAMRGRFYIDEFYDAAVVRPLYGLASWSESKVDRLAVDASLDRASEASWRISEKGRKWQSGYLRHYALAFSLGGSVLAVAALLLGSLIGQGR